MKNLTLQLIKKIFVIFPLTFCMLSLVAVVGINVFCRFILGFSISWAEEFARFAFIWVSFLGAALAFLNNKHFAIVFFIKKVKLEIRKPILIAGNILSTIFIGFLLIKGVGIIKETIFQHSPIIGMSMGWIYLSFAYCFIIMFVFSIYETLKLFKIS